MSTGQQDPTTLKFGKYKVVAKLGQGAMGIVYKGFDDRMDRWVAIKTLFPAYMEREENRRRFFKEATATSRLVNPHIVRIYDFDQTDDGVPYLVMEFLEGFDLRQIREYGIQLSIPEILEIIIQVSEGLHYAHQKGVVHRDVKPANIMLLRQGGVKILDFGIARVTEGPQFTRSGVSLGTPIYMSPEQAKGLVVDHRADQYSVGLIVYELIAGANPFQADSVTSVLLKVIEMVPPALGGLAPGCPPALSQAVQRSLAKDPDLRFPSLLVFAEICRRVAAGFKPQEVGFKRIFRLLQPGQPVATDSAARLSLIGRHLEEARRQSAQRCYAESDRLCRLVLDLDPENQAARGIFASNQRELEKRSKILAILNDLGSIRNIPDWARLFERLAELTQVSENPEETGNVIAQAMETFYAELERRLAETAAAVSAEGELAWLGDLMGRPSVRAFFTEPDHVEFGREVVRRIHAQVDRLIDAERFEPARQVLELLGPELRGYPGWEILNLDLERLLLALQAQASRERKTAREARLVEVIVSDSEQDVPTVIEAPPAEKKEKAETRAPAAERPEELAKAIRSEIQQLKPDFEILHEIREIEERMIELRRQYKQDSGRDDLRQELEFLERQKVQLESRWDTRFNVFEVNRLIGRNRFLKAEQLLRKLEQVSPPLAEAQELRRLYNEKANEFVRLKVLEAEALFWEGKADKAIRSLEKALVERPESPELAEALLRLENASGS